VALAAGPDVVFQGAFLSGNWGGWSDFLERVETPSALGSFSYEVADTKLKRRADPKHVLQLVLYSDLLAEIQGVVPEFAHVELGDGTRATLRLADYSAYARMARARLEAFVAGPQPTRPIPCADCCLCRWADHCNIVRQAEDSLFNVANISRGHVKKLEAAGVNTLEGLSTLDYPIRGMADNTLARLITQARLQQARKSGEPEFELRAPEPGKGFDLLPEPQTGDLFYDIGGDPHYEGGLEYLHGIWFDAQFLALWAHDHDAEARALADLLAFFRARITEYPDARIYHYAPYATTALKCLTAKYGIGEAFLDRLLRERRFDDLFAVVRGGLIGSEPNYSIKSMEAFYDRQRDGEVKTAGGSVVAYERGRETQDQQVLDEIEDYNRVDCISIEELRDWLVGIRPNGPWPILAPDVGDKEVEEDVESEALRSALAASGLPEDWQKMLFNLSLFHKREVKSAQWVVFDSAAKEGFDIARCTGARLMKDIGIEGVIRGKRPRTTIRDKALPCPLDGVNRQFHASASNTLWVSDLTYVATWQGFVYVAFVIDVFARRIVGWRASRTANTGFVRDALQQAIHQRRPAQDQRLHHPDRGSQFLSIKYTKRLAELQIASSAGSVGDSYDNALAETINGVFKAEVIHRRGPWRSFEAVEYATLEWVDWFKNCRLLEPLGTIPPAEAEANFYADLERSDMAA